MSEQHNDHVLTWIIWRSALCGISFMLDINGSRKYLDPEDVYVRNDGTLERKSNARP